MITSLALAAGALVGYSGPAAAATRRAAPGQAVRAAAPAAGAYVGVRYPTAIRRGGFITYDYRVKHLRRLESDAVVIVAFLPRNTPSKVRFLSKPAHSSCGYYSSRAYCVVRLTGADGFSARLRVWVKYKYAGRYRTDHYARAVNFESGLSTRDYVEEVTRGDLMARSRTTIYRR
ncbi:hypothetical protein [Sphaerisporangium fuscum]|uniref:hypothetical protein n=1 Tax=Sphaerisporangium fuscum TaxID=2835868 RepID=UPI001BDC5162|nr:hypothetical protein [Sphaerisporangium fuscum]